MTSPVVVIDPAIFTLATVSTKATARAYHFLLSTFASVSAFATAWAKTDDPVITAPLPMSMVDSAWAPERRIQLNSSAYFSPSVALKSDRAPFTFVASMSMSALAAELKSPPVANATGLNSAPADSSSAGSLSSAEETTVMLIRPPLISASPLVPIVTSAVFHWASKKPRSAGNLAVSAALITISPLSAPSSPARASIFAPLSITIWRPSSVIAPAPESLPLSIV